MCNKSNENRDNKLTLWVALELFKAGGDNRLKSLTNIFNDILFENKLPEE